MSSQPVFSVIVPTHQRPAQLVRCLTALVQQDYPIDAFEIIVVEDGGAAETGAALVDFRARANSSIQFLLQPSRGGPAIARNAGAAAAKGRYLAFTDDDCEPAPNWLSRLAVHLERHAASAVGGLIVNSLPSVPYSTASQLLIDYLYEYYRVELTGNRFFTSNNLAVPAREFRDVGGFDESFPLAAAEDREFCERWQRRGYRLVYAADVVVSHGHRLNLSGFLRQHFNYGRGADFLHRSRSRYDGAPARPKLEPLSFYVNLVRFPVRSGLSLQRLSMVGLLSLSQIAYGAGYFAERLTQKRSR